MRRAPVFALGFFLIAAGCAAASPGTILSSAPMAAPAGARAWKITYQSTGLRNEPIVVSGVIVAPATPGRNRSVVAWAHPTTGVAEKCAPSASPALFQKIPDIGDLIARGYVVAATDYPGLGTPGPHPYLIGESEARAVIDSVRAARNIPAAGAGKRYVAWGHSQGGHAALFVGQIARSYAPDLSLVGVAAIAPPTQLAPILREDLGESMGRVLTGYTVWSWSKIYGVPMLSVVRLRTAVPLVNAIARTCAETKGEGYSLAFDAAWTSPRLIKPSIYTESPWAGLIAANSPVPSSGPYYVAQGTDDKIVPPAQTASFVAAICRTRARVDFDSLTGQGHMMAAFVSAQHAFAWMADRFANKPAPTTCS